MRAIGVKDFDGGAQLLNLPVPEPGEGEVLVAVRAASLNGTDVAVASGATRGHMEHRFPVTLGQDFAGTVEATGPGVTRFSVGDELIGVKPPSMQLNDKGTLAEYVTVPQEGFIERRPANLDFVQGAALGLAGTAGQVAVDSVALSPGQTVLIVGATGGVGSYAVQLAKDLGAHVIATGLPDDEKSLRELGADEVVDYTTDIAAYIVERHPDGIDALIDLVSFDPGAFSTLTALVREGGLVTSSVGAVDVDALAARGVTGTNLYALADPGAFHRVVAAAADGRVQVPLDQVLRFEDAFEGLDQMARGQARGKISVRIG